MLFNKDYANIYLVTGIITVLVVFSVITFVIIEDNISSGSSAQIVKEQLQEDK